MFDSALAAAAVAAPGFLPAPEGLALYEAGLSAPAGPLLEIGSYCGKSAVYLGAAARARGGLLFSLDHHRGSEEHQPGEEYHDPAHLDPELGLVDTLPCFRRTIAGAGLEGSVVAVVGPSAAVAAAWRTPLALVFIDGGHSQPAADADLDGWSPHLVPGGLLCIHDVYPDPSQGGRPPFLIYQRALSRGYLEEAAAGSLRILRRPGTKSRP